jgi:pimeloyl-ACP methyl ester carboxylesterase
VDRIDVDGYHLAYRRGGADTGTPVIFISSLGTPGSDWFETIEHVGEPIEWLVYNRASIGSSDQRPEPATHGYRVRTDELAQLVNTLGFPTPAVIVGHSIGALIARDLATTQPVMVMVMVMGLVLVESSFDGLTPTPTDEPFQIYDGQELLDAERRSPPARGRQSLSAARTEVQCEFANLFSTRSR